MVIDKLAIYYALMRLLKRLREKRAIQIQCTLSPFKMMAFLN
jgi:hypothetical protein